MMRRLIQILILLAVVVVLPSTLMACPTCKQGLADATNNPNLVRGYGWSIMFMMSAPFLILSGVGGYFYYEICRARAAQPQVARERIFDQPLSAV
jgi:hypothetical protein